jgi:predicted phosphoadenosine phosphosulfate sulfurtransferase
MWIDQEAEWRFTVEQNRSMMYHPDVDPHWYQIPMKLFNATSQSDNWLHCWDPAAKDKWIHPHDPISIKQNVYGTDRFHHLFDAIIGVEFPGTPTVNLSGVRCEESPGRTLGLTEQLTYKWATWGKVVSTKHRHYTMCPIYDWSYSDVWKAIHEHGWTYNRIYDLQYQHGIQVRNMRVSNVHHETAVHSLFYLQEAEPETYARLTRRLSGVDMAAKLGTDDYFVSELPFMFSSWKEYRDYLLEHLIETQDWRDRMASIFASHDRTFGDGLGDKMYQAHIQSILTHDWEGIKLKNFESGHFGMKLKRLAAKRAQLEKANAPAV